MPRATLDPSLSSGIRAKLVVEVVICSSETQVTYPTAREAEKKAC